MAHARAISGILRTGLGSEQVLVRLHGDEPHAGIVGSQEPLDVTPTNARACGNAEECVSVRCGVAGTTKGCTVNRTILDFGEWSEAIERTAWTVANCTIGPCHSVTGRSVEALHGIYPLSTVVMLWRIQ